MKTIVIYNSQTGFTKRYAEWIAEATGGACVSLKEAQGKDYSEYDTIVFGSWCMAGSLAKLNWFKERMNAWKGKKLIVFAVGASPIENPELEEGLAKFFTEDEKKDVDLFYCPGGLCYEKMKMPSKLGMKMFTKMMQGKKDKTEEEKAMAEMIAKSYDISDRKYAEPVIAKIMTGVTL